MLVLQAQAKRRRKELQRSSKRRRSGQVSGPDDEEPSSSPSAHDADVSPSAELQDDTAKEGKRDRSATKSTGLEEFIDSLMP